MSEVTRIKKVERSPKGLVDALFDAMDNLNEKTMNPDEVRAVAHTARVIVNVARLEMDAVQIQEKMGKRVDFKALPDLGARPPALEEKAPA